MVCLLPSIATDFYTEISLITDVYLLSKELQDHFCDRHTIGLSLKGLEEVGLPKDTLKPYLHGQFSFSQSTTF